MVNSSNSLRGRNQHSAKMPMIITLQRKGSWSREQRLHHGCLPDSLSPNRGKTELDRFRVNSKTANRGAIAIRRSQRHPECDGINKGKTTFGFLAAKAQLNTCTCVSVCLCVCLSVSKLNFCLFNPLYM